MVLESSLINVLFGSGFVWIKIMAKPLIIRYLHWLLPLSLLRNIHRLVKRRLKKEAKINEAIIIKNKIPN